MDVMQDPRTIEAFGFTIESHYNNMDDPVEINTIETTFHLYSDGLVGVTMWTGAWPFANDHDMGILSSLWEACSYADWLLKRENFYAQRDQEMLDRSYRATRHIAATRDERDPCEAGTPGCCIDHNRDDGPCETW